MPTLCKYVTIFNSDQGYGWQEIHYRNVGTTTPNLLEEMNYWRTTVAPLRAQLLGEDCAIVGYRVSYPRADDVASYGLREYVPGPDGHTGAAAQLSLAIVFNDATYTKKKVVHLRGFWDSIEYNESYHPEAPEAAGWTDALTAWKQALVTAQFGWPTKSVPISSSGQVLSYTEEADGRISFTLAAPFGAGVAIGSNVKVRFSRINGSQSPLNRELLCTVTAASELTTVRQVAAGPFRSKGKWNYRGTAFVAYANTGSISIGQRRMGRPLNRMPGRSAVKPLY